MFQPPFGFVAGIPIVESIYMTESKEVDRGWRERLFSRPWRPWCATKEIQVPSRQAIGFGDPPRQLIMHPSLAAEVRRALEERTA